ncbi:PRKCSH domain-containing protein ASCRUDRAFT_85372 [Ascoidea rubescens DSM 1968]|uniref:Endoplasmic reticulum lectin n=1 Tax=Ascoidea rubescens DSM 1968 TaxID=1344418 RepID=A0A1D2VJT7_9ASCO|nr:hypothetical protein ASCRUDRAFT_85372 [Ascoidea rubescens DSM 1968]ODV61850.1 hypothetical protein ASCRUDRAFT_85372 [Ascoidea rubescens DSM 1968]
MFCAVLLLLATCCLVDAFNPYDDIFSLPKFQINYINSPSISRRDSLKLLSSNSLNYEVIRLTNAHNEEDSYLCTLPSLAEIHQNEKNDLQFNTNTHPNKIFRYNADPHSNSNNDNSINNNDNIENNENNGASDDDYINENLLRNKSIEIINQSLNDICLYYTSGYWTYEFCYNNKITQFHNINPLYYKSSYYNININRKNSPSNNNKNDITADNSNQFIPKMDPNIPIFTLGRFMNSTKNINANNNNKNKIIHSPKSLMNYFQLNDYNYYNQNKKSLSITIDHGSKCDLTNLNRMIDIIFICNSNTNTNNKNNNKNINNKDDSNNNLNINQIKNSVNDQPSILSIKEYKTCQYEMQISVPDLCSLCQFNNVNQFNSINKINCQLINNDHNNDNQRKDNNDKNVQDNTETNNNNDDNKKFATAVDFFKDHKLYHNKINLPDYHLLPTINNIYLGTKLAAHDNHHINAQIENQDIEDSEIENSEIESIFLINDPLVDLVSIVENKNSIFSSVLKSLSIAFINTLNSKKLVLPKSLKFENGIDSDVGANYYFKIGDQFKFISPVYDYKGNYLFFISVGMYKDGRYTLSYDFDYPYLYFENNKKNWVFYTVSNNVFLKDGMGKNHEQQQIIIY